MFYNAHGQPDPNGRFQLIDGVIKLRGSSLEHGQSVSFDIAMMDSAKSEPPKSIDESLKRTLGETAKGQNKSVAELLAGMDRKKLDELVAQVAQQFISGKASEAIAAEFSDELAYRVTAAKAKHDLGQAHRPAEQRQPFVADAALAQAITSKVRDRATQMALASDPLNDADFRHGMDVAGRVTGKHIISNDWRR